MGVIKEKLRRARRSQDGAEDTVLVRLYAKLDELELHALKRPVDRKTGEPLEARLPSDLTALSDEQLGRRYTDFCRMAQYTQQRLAILGVEKAIAKTKDRYARAETRLLQTGPAADKLAKVEVDELVRERGIDLLTAEGVERITHALFESYVIGKDACSRELTRRMAVPPDPELRR